MKSGPSKITEEIIYITLSL